MGSSLDWESRVWKLWSVSFSVQIHGSRQPNVLRSSGADADAETDGIVHFVAYLLGFCYPRTHLTNDKIYDPQGRFSFSFLVLAGMVSFRFSFLSKTKASSLILKPMI